MTHIRVDQAGKRWGDEILFENISFSAVFGERIGLVGVNGSGKSICVICIWMSTGLRISPVCPARNELSWLCVFNRG